MRARDAARIHACSRVRHAHLVAAERAESGGRLTSECLGDPFSHRPSVAAIRAYVFSQPPKRWHARSADVPWVVYVKLCNFRFMAKVVIS